MEYYSPLPADHPGGNLTANPSVLQAAPVRFELAREITIKKTLLAIQIKKQPIKRPNGVNNTRSMQASSFSRRQSEAC